jgi:hypothetical protein
VPATDPAALKKAANDHPGRAWAGGIPAVEGFLRRVVADLNRPPALVVEHAEFDRYGSGYASFVDVLLTRRDGSLRRTENGRTEVEGVSLALCRLAPVAVLMKDGWRSQIHLLSHSEGPTRSGRGLLAGRGDRI